MSATGLGVIGVLVLVAILLFGQFLYWTIQGRRQVRDHELARRIGSLRAPAEEEAARTLLRERPADDTAEGTLSRWLREAGVEGDAPAILRRAWITGLCGALAGLLLLRHPAGVLLAGLGAAPMLRALSLAAAREARLAEQLPDALDLLARSLAAGQGLVDGLRGVAEEIPAPLGPAFARAWEEQNLGRDLRDVLGDLCARHPGVFDLRIFSSAVLLQRQTGGNLVEILQNLARTLRERAAFRGRVRALTAEARFTGWMLGGLPFAVAGLILLVQPGYLAPLVRDPLGRGILLGCAGAFAVGVGLIRRAARVEA